MAESTVPTTQQPPTAPNTRESARTLSPPVDIFENADGLVVVADLPGVSKEGVDVRVENGTLTLKAQAKSNCTAEPLYEEYRLLDFYRQFQLSETVDQEQIRAELKNGVLMLTLPKKEKAKPKQIEVKVS